MSTRGHHGVLLNAAAAVVASFPEYLSTTPSNDFSGSTSHTINMPAYDTGDLLLIFFLNDGAATVTPDAGLTGLQTVFSTARLSDYRMSLYTWVAPGSAAAGTVTFTTSAGEHMACLVYRIAAGTFDPSTLPEYAMNLTLSGTSADPPELTPSWGSAKTLWFACYAGGNASAANDPSTYPFADNNVSQPSNPTSGGTGSVRAASCTSETEAASINPGAFTKGGTGNSSAFTVAIRPAI